MAAMEAIGRKTKELDGEDFGGTEWWISESKVLMGSDGHAAIRGLPKLDLYDGDFGWGRPRKIEEISIDGMKLVISLTESIDFKGGIKIRLVLPKNQMDFFCFYFSWGSQGSCLMDFLARILVRFFMLRCCICANYNSCCLMIMDNHMKDFIYVSIPKTENVKEFFYAISKKYPKFSNNKKNKLCDNQLVNVCFESSVIDVSSDT